MYWVSGGGMNDLNSISEVPCERFTGKLVSGLRSLYGFPQSYQSNTVFVP